PRVILEHRRSMIREGFQVVVPVVFAAAIFIRYIVLIIWTSEGVDAWIFALCLTLMVVILSVVAYRPVTCIRAGGEFLCRLDENEIRCACPVAGVADSFTVMINDIETIEHQIVQHEDSGHCRWYLWNTSSHRYHLPSTCGNPAEQFVERIKELNPKIAEITT
ncbi:MAG: hypothetical protein N2C14_20835, partial [Planctomycetales bacterium]